MKVCFVTIVGIVIASITNGLVMLMVELKIISEASYFLGNRGSNLSFLFRRLLYEKHPEFNKTGHDIMFGTERSNNFELYFFFI